MPCRILVIKLGCGNVQITATITAMNKPQKKEMTARGIVYKIAPSIIGQNELITYSARSAVINGRLANQLLSNVIAKPFD